MYYTEADPFTGEPIFVAKDFRSKVRQKRIVTGKRNPRHRAGHRRRRR
jgi:hypothetical protein